MDGTANFQVWSDAGMHQPCRQEWDFGFLRDQVNDP
jgi:hypothetical protein